MSELIGVAAVRGCRRPAAIGLTASQAGMRAVPPGPVSPRLSYFSTVMPALISRLGIQPGENVFFLTVIGARTTSAD